MSKEWLLSIAGMFDSQEETNAEAFHNEEKLRKERK